MTLARQMLLALLGGLLVTVGGLVAPLLFATLDDRSLAGRIAGGMFHAANLVTLVLVLMSASLGGWAVRGPRQRVVLLAPAILLATSEWLVHPIIEAEKQTHGSKTTAFAVWHGLSSGLYLLATLAALWALAWELRRSGTVNLAE